MKHFTQQLSSLQRMVFLCCFLMGSLCFSLKTVAQTFTVDSLTYRIDQFQFVDESAPRMGATLWESNPELVHAVIPESVVYEGTSYPVLAIGPAEMFGPEISHIKPPFYKHKTLCSVTIPSSVRILGDFAFARCENLQSIRFGQYTDPKQGLNIFTQVIADCPKLTTLEIPEYTHFAPSSFSASGTHMGSFAYSSLKQVHIPGTCVFDHEGHYSHDDIYRCNSVFRRCYQLESVTIGEGITRLPSYMFYECPQLVSVTLPESLVEVGPGAFGVPEYPAYATPYILNQPDGMIYLGKTAYTYKGDVPEGSVISIRPGTRIISADLLFLDKLKKATIHVPNTVEYIDWKITSNMVFEEGNPYYYLQEGILYSNGGRTLLNAFDLAVTDFTIPSTVSYIAGGAFSDCTSLRSLTIPATCTVLSSSFCKGCTSLERVVLLGDNQLENGMFSDCPSLKEVIIGGNYVRDTVRYWSDEGYLTNLVYPFEGNSTIETLTFTDDVDYIGRLFTDTATINVQNLRLPEKVKWIGKGAFRNFKKLASVCLPSMEYAGSAILEGCTALEQADVSKMTDSIPADMFKGCTQLSTVRLPENATSLGAGAFSGCTQLSAIRLPESVATLGANAFEGCTQLSAVNLEHVKSMGNFCFFNCYALKDIQTPALEKIGIHPLENSGYSSLTDGVYYLGTTACGYNAALPDTVAVPIEIREGTTEILPYAFSPFIDGSSILENRRRQKIQFPISIPGSVHVIGTRAFKMYASERGEMASLFNLPEGVECIGDEAFRNLVLDDTLFVLPASVDSVGLNAFDLKKLTSLYVQTEVPCKIAINGYQNSFGLTRFQTMRGVTLYVPAGSKTAYESSAWGKLFKYIEEYEGLPTSVHSPLAGNSCVVRVTDEGLFVGAAANVYSLEGHLVASCHRSGVLNLPKGHTYVVRSKGASVKVYIPR